MSLKTNANYKHPLSFSVFFILPIVLIILTASTAFSDRDEDKYMKPVSNPAYRQACGTCHFAYLPELLPSGSWKLILDNHGKLFGTEPGVDDSNRQAILKYLTSNAADQSRAKRPRKIMKNLRGNLPARITDIPYIREKHDEVSPDIFERKSIGSFSNCNACHRTAGQGIFEDDNVDIPR